MSHLALGLNSGTSADGISAVLASFSGRKYEILGTLTFDYPDEIRSQVLKGPFLGAAQVSRLHVELGDLFAQAANKLLKKCHVSPKRVSCIGSHGQTVYHGPRDEVINTLQLGDPALIAERTGIDVVSNFRQRDIAVGGEGAPLIPFFDLFFFGHGPVKAFQNIGGIANVAIVGKTVKSPIAFDTGPGNCLMDAAMRMLTNGEKMFDRNGEMAKSGNIDTDTAAKMLKHPYFKTPPPKSTGPEIFNSNFVLEHFGSDLKNRSKDIMATLNYLTCISIQEAFRSFVFPKYPVEEIVVSGGGSLNKCLMNKLECLFAPIPVISIETLGIPTQAKEPLAFAFYGLRNKLGKLNHLPEPTGAKEARILGSLTKA
jgi:anhydro-N-acetylmuramic acid kinase